MASEKELLEIYTNYLDNVKNKKQFTMWIVENADLPWFSTFIKQNFSSLVLQHYQESVIKNKKQKSEGFHIVTKKIQEKVNQITAIDKTTSYFSKEKLNNKFEEREWNALLAANLEEYEFFLSKANSEKYVDSFIKRKINKDNFSEAILKYSELDALKRFKKLYKKNFDEEIRSIAVNAIAKKYWSEDDESIRERMSINELNDFFKRVHSIENFEMWINSNEKKRWFATVLLKYIDYFTFKKMMNDCQNKNAQSKEVYYKVYSAMLAEYDDLLKKME